MNRLLRLAVCLLALCGSGPALASDLLQRVLEAAPAVSAKALELALEARRCAAAHGAAPLADRMAVIDYSLPSTEPRMWVLDLAQPRLLHAEHVAHGRGSGENLATDFSNAKGSHQTSLGLFLTADTYDGGNGYSLRMDGLDPGVNDLARERYIVMHGAPYVDPERARQQGRLGRSHGCPALRPEVAREIIDTLREGQLVFAYYPDPDWLSRSPHLGCEQRVAAEASEDLSGRLGAEGTPLWVDGSALHDPDAVRRFYRQRGHRRAFTGPGCEIAMDDLVGAIESAHLHGLDPSAYHLDALRSPDRCLAEREILAADAWLTLGAHLHAGRLDPVSVEPDWTASRPVIDLVARLEEALARGDVGGALEGLAPPHPFYAALREALARYRGYAARGGWQGVEEGPPLRLGDGGRRVAQLRERLRLSGLLTEITEDPGAPFDSALDAGVRAFQRRANLEPDGVVGPHTLRQLNRRAEDRIAQLRVNLERWRWLPEDLGERHLRVNIAEFQLEARAAGRVERQHRVIVGRQYRQTPSFSASLTHVVLNPWWEVPRRLAVEDKLPLFRRDPDLVERLGFQFVDTAGKVVDPDEIDLEELGFDYFPYRLRQRPGPENALGQVKFMLPNSHDVYLHDTPSRGLFARVRRDFSSGCIRVEEALDLAEWVLSNAPGWGRARIDDIVAGGETASASLGEPVSVHLHYLTAVATPEGGVRFLDDLYGRDLRVLEALDAPPPAPRPTETSGRTATRVLGGPWLPPAEPSLGAAHRARGASSL